MKEKESDLAVTIFQRLQYIPKHKAVYFSVPNERPGGTNVRQMVRLKRQGLTKGVSDLWILMPDRCIGIELKTSKGRQSTAQKEFESWCNLVGIEYELVRSLEELEIILKKWGLS